MTEARAVRGGSPVAGPRVGTPGTGGSVVGSLRVLAVPADHPDAVELRRAMYRDLAIVYPRETARVEELGGFAWLDEGRAGSWLDVLVAYADAVPVGCAGTRAAALPGHPPGSVEELRAVYVVAGLRRRGVARALHTALLERARSRGARVLLLETGTAQPAALAAYRALGWTPTERFDPHEEDPTSRYLRLELPA